MYTKQGYVQVIPFDDIIKKRDHLKPIIIRTAKDVHGERKTKYGKEG
jgi:hypothetical protein